MRFAKDAPVIGLVLQRSHLVTGDEGHYSGVVASLEAQGAKVMNHPKEKMNAKTLLIVSTKKLKKLCLCLIFLQFNKKS